MNILYPHDGKKKSVLFWCTDKTDYVQKKLNKLSCFDLQVVCHSKQCSGLFSVACKSGDRYLIIQQEEMDTIRTGPTLLKLQQGENPINYFIFYNILTINYVTGGSL